MQLAGRPAARPAPKPRPAPLPPTHAASHSVGQAIHQAAAPRTVGRVITRAAAPPRSVGRAVSSVVAPHHATIASHSDIQSSGASYGRQRANAYKKTAAYRKAVVDTFLHQPNPVKMQILRGAAQNPTFEGKLALDAATKLGPLTFAGDLKEKAQKTGGFSLKDLNPEKLIPDLTSGMSGSGTGPGMAAINAPTTEIGAGTQQLGQTLQNAGKDAVDLPAQTFTMGATVASDTIHKGPAAGLHDVIGQYEDWIKHPSHLVESFKQHPLDTYLAIAGAVHGATRIPDAAVRALKPGDTLAREGVQLRGNMTQERARLSPYPLIRASQKALDKARYERGPTGKLIPKNEDSNFIAKRTQMQTSRLVGFNERMRQANRDETIRARAKAVRASRPARITKGARTALKYGEQRGAKIAGAPVLSRIADLTVRRPETLREDLLKHAEQVAANRPSLIEDTSKRGKKLLAEHDQYVKTIRQAAERKYTPAQLQKVFAAAAQYAKDYQPTENEAFNFGQFHGHTKESLKRAALGHYAITHMGARFAPELGDTGQLVGPGGEPLSTERIAAHAKKATGGREAAFTSDKAKRGSAFYISSERRPLPEGQKRTYFAFTHGLTDPGDVGLLEQHVRMQGKVDAHKAVNRLIDQNVTMRDDGSAWSSYKKAEAAAPDGYVPVALSQPFHPQEALNKALEGTNPSNLEQEAQTHGLDLSARLTDSGQGRWGLIDQNVLKRVEEHKAQITSNTGLRAIKGATNIFRNVALGTSAKHVPGVAAEAVIRSIANAEGLMSWVTGHRALKNIAKADPELGKAARIQVTGGTVAGSAKMMMTHSVAEAYRGTSLYGPLKAWETFRKTPGPRQMRTAWNAYISFALSGTKKMIEEQSQTASLGKELLRQFGSEHGPFFKALRIQGKIYEDAQRGRIDPAKLRQWRAAVEQVRGRWTDLTPIGKTAMMFSPFGLWWVNSAKWLARSPIDRPVQTGVLASATMGTEKERMAKGEDLFAPNALPLFMQGGVPLGGGKVLAQNYYSPFGIANNPLETGGSLFEPTFLPIAFGAFGKNYLDNPLTSPSNPKGYKNANTGLRLQSIGNSLLGLFVPLYSKAEQIAAGGASTYDSSTLFDTQTKEPNGGIVAGAKKALQPFRTYGGTKSSRSSGGSGYFGGGSSSGSGSGGSGYFGGSSSSSSSGGGSGYF